MLLLLVLAGWFVAEIVEGLEGKLIGVEVVAFGFCYPWLVSFNDELQGLWLNIGACLLLAVTALQLFRAFRRSPNPDNSQIS